MYIVPLGTGESRCSLKGNEMAIFEIEATSLSYFCRRTGRTHMLRLEDLPQATIHHLLTLGFTTGCSNSFASAKELQMSSEDVEKAVLAHVRKLENGEVGVGGRSLDPVEREMREVLAQKMLKAGFGKISGLRADCAKSFDSCLREYSNKLALSAGKPADLVIAKVLDVVKAEAAKIVATRNTVGDIDLSDLDM